MRGCSSQALPVSSMAPPRTKAAQGSAAMWDKRSCRRARAPTPPHALPRRHPSPPRPRRAPYTAASRRCVGRGTRSVYAINASASTHTSRWPSRPVGSPRHRSTTARVRRGGGGSRGGCRAWEGGGGGGVRRWDAREGGPEQGRPPGGRSGVAWRRSPPRTVVHPRTPRTHARTRTCMHANARARPPTPRVPRTRRPPSDGSSTRSPQTSARELWCRRVQGVVVQASAGSCGAGECSKT